MKYDKNNQNEKAAQEMILRLSEKAAEVFETQLSEIAPNLTESQVEEICEIHKSHIVKSVGPFVFSLLSLGCTFRATTNPDEINKLQNECDSVETIDLYKTDDSDDSQDPPPLGDKAFLN